VILKKNIKAQTKKKKERSLEIQNSFHDKLCFLKKFSQKLSSFILFYLCLKSKTTELY